MIENETNTKALQVVELVNARCGYLILSNNCEAAITAVGKHQAGCLKCRAQEEPKVTTMVCDIARYTHAGPVLMRWIKIRQAARPSLAPTCEQCHVLNERAGRFGGMFTASILRDPDIADRLPRPALAHVAGMH